DAPRPLHRAGVRTGVRPRAPAVDRAPRRRGLSAGGGSARALSLGRARLHGAAIRRHGARRPDGLPLPHLAVRLDDAQRPADGSRSEAASSPGARRHPVGPVRRGVAGGAARGAAALQPDEGYARPHPPRCLGAAGSEGVPIGLTAVAPSKAMIGRVLSTGSATVTAEHVADFARALGDPNPLYVDSEAGAPGPFGA